MKSHLLRVTGYLLGLAAMLIVAVLVGRMWNLDGVVRPDKLTDVAAVAEESGDKFEAPEKGACVLLDEQSERERELLDVVYSDEFVDCEITRDAIDWDTALGFGGLVLIAALVIVGVLVNKKKVEMNGLLLLFIIITSAVVGGLIVAHLASPDLNVVGTFFWVGAGSAAIISLGGWFAYEAHKP